MIIKHVISLIGCLETPRNLKLVVLILTFHPLVSLITPLLCVKFSIVLITTVILVLVIFLMIVLLNCPVW